MDDKDRAQRKNRIIAAMSVTFAFALYGVKAFIMDIAGVFSQAEKLPPEPEKPETKPIPTAVAQPDMTEEQWMENLLKLPDGPLVEKEVTQPKLVPLPNPEPEIAKATEIATLSFVPQSPEALMEFTLQRGEHDCMPALNVGNGQVSFSLADNKIQTHKVDDVLGLRVTNKNEAPLYVSGHRSGKPIRFIIDSGEGVVHFQDIDGCSEIGIMDGAKVHIHLSAQEMEQLKDPKNTRARWEAVGEYKVIEIGGTKISFSVKEAPNVHFEGEEKVKEKPKPERHPLDKFERKAPKKLVDLRDTKFERHI